MQAPMAGAELPLPFSRAILSISRSRRPSTALFCGQVQERRRPFSEARVPRHIAAQLRPAIPRESCAKSWEGRPKRPDRRFQVRLRQSALHSAIQPFFVLPRTTPA